MKLATWNVERLKHHKDMNLMLKEIKDLDADILVLTETDSRLLPDYPYYYHTPLLMGNQIVQYADTENRVTIFSKYESIAKYETYDKYTSICVEFVTDKGNLVVYGTVMGIFGNRQPGFKEDVTKQMEDVRRLVASGKNVCVIGDYNLSFADNYYYTEFGRDLVNNTFADCGISILTGDREQCVDHIAVSYNYVGGANIIVKEWNHEKTLSDHKGIMVELKGLR